MVKRNEFGIGSEENPAPPAHVESLETEQVTTVGTHTTAAINDAITNYDVAVLQQGASYSGDTTIEIDPSNRGAAVIAYGATIDYTGSGVAVDVLPNSDTDFDGAAHWYGGRIIGPGHTTTGSVGVRFTDTFGSELKPRRVEDFETGIKGQNENAWSEYNIVEARVDECQTGVLLDGGQDGSGFGMSFKGLDLKMRYEASIDGATGIDLEDANTIDNYWWASIRHGGDNCIGLDINGGVHETNVIDLDVGDSDSITGQIGVRMTDTNGTLSGSPYIRRRLINCSTEIDNQTSVEVINQSSRAGELRWYADNNRVMSLTQTSGPVFHGTSLSQVGAIDADQGGTNINFRSGQSFISTGGDSWSIRGNAQNIMSWSEGALPKAPNNGPNGNGGIQFANARIYENGSGEIVVEDSSGNTTTIS